MYKKPILLRQEDMAEGVFAASGSQVTTLYVDLSMHLPVSHIMVTFNTDVAYVAHTIGGYQNGNQQQDYQPELSFRKDDGSFVSGSITVRSKDPSIVPEIIGIKPIY